MQTSIELKDRCGRWTAAGRGATLGSQRKDFCNALQTQGSSTVYAYLRDSDSPSGKAGSPYYIGVAGSVRRPYKCHGPTPVPSDERRIRMLRSNVTHEQAREWERFYIAKYGRKDIGSGRQMLMNRTDGGDGMAGVQMSTETRAKLAEVARNMSTETRIKISEANRGKVKSTEHRTKIATAMRGKAASVETRAKMSKAQQGMSRSAETRAKIAEANRGKSLSIETRLKLAESRIRAAATRNGVSPDLWAQMSKGQRSNSLASARNKGISVAQYIETMRPKWGI